MTRSRIDSLVFALVVILGASYCALAAPPATQPIPLKPDESLAHGLAFLAKQQSADGSFGAGGSPPVATTALVLLALLADGNPPDVGRYGLAARSAIDFLLEKIPDDGYVGAEKSGKGDSSRMYGQGIVTLALAEAYGVEDDRDERLKLQVAITKLLGVILAAQAAPKSAIHAGGWGVAPDSRDSDLSVSGWNVMALRACRDAGFNVPKDALDAAGQYVMKCRNPLDKGFAYQPGGQGEAGTTGIAIVCLYLLDSTAKSELRDAQKFLSQAAARPPSARFPYASKYFTVQAGLQAGDATWEAVSRPTFDALLTTQAPDGGWPASPAATEEPGRAYATAVAVLSLSVPQRLLPVYAK